MKSQKDSSTLKVVLSIVSIALFLAFVFMLWVYPEVKTGAMVFGGLLLVSLVLLIMLNQKQILSTTKERSFRYGANSFVTVFLVLSILAVINILNYNKYYRKDLTAAKLSELSDQTVKLLKEIKDELKVTVIDKSQNRDADLGFLKNYEYIVGSKLKSEFIDPDRDPSRVRALNAKKYGTVILETQGHEVRIEELTEEKFSNALMKLVQSKPIEICFLKDHGEKDIDTLEATGLSNLRQGLFDQTYTVKTISLIQEGKVPESCTVVATMGPTKAFLKNEIDLLAKYLDNYGHLFVALDTDVRVGADTHPLLTKLLSDWYVDYRPNLVLDLSSRLLGQNADVSLVTQYNASVPMVKDMKEAALFPLASALSIKDGSPKHLRVDWAAQTSDKAFAKIDFKEIRTGRVKIDPQKDKKGPHPLVVAVDGTKGEPTGTQKTKIVVMGSSLISTNQYSRFGGNQDLVLNAFSWLADDENLISIRKKDEGSQAFSLTEAEARFIQYTILFIIPGLTIALGIYVWMKRRRL